MSLASRTVGVVVPCFNEGHLIDRVLTTMPPFVDRVIVVDDASVDDTAQVARSAAARLEVPVDVLRHDRNLGVGAAIVSGYRHCLHLGLDVVAVMAGDGQMAPEDLRSVVEPVATGAADFVKGNRLFYEAAWKVVPRYRYVGNLFLSLFTKIASGYWHIADSQSGYTAVSRQALAQLDLDGLYSHYGFPNHLLIKLNVVNARVRDVPVRPIYRVGEKSGLRLWRVVPALSLLLVRGFFWRLLHKYVIRNFHPLVLFYACGLSLLPLGAAWGLALVILRIVQGPVSATSALLAALLVISGLQLLLFAMWFDYQDNSHLRA
ncbi:MAG: glycosyltransferase family 2 protein [Dehalococcoidia bacterium]